MAIHAHVLVSSLLLPNKGSQWEHLIDLLPDIIIGTSERQVLLGKIHLTIRSHNELQDIDLN